MRNAEKRAREEGKLLADGAVPMISSDVIAMPAKEGVKPRARNMVLPVAAMVVMMPVGLFITGQTAIAEKISAMDEKQVRLAEESEALEVLLAEPGRVAVAEREGVRALVVTDRRELAPVYDAPLARHASIQQELLDLSELHRPTGFFDTLGEGSGSTSVLWAVVVAVLLASLLALGQGILGLAEVSDLVIKGAAGLMPMAVIMVLAFAINATCNTMGTGPFVASVVEPLLSPALLPMLLFITACFIAFSTGTSWGTFGIMMPIGVPLAAATGVGLPLVVASILGGGVFGDHCSPISDTTVISSMATASDHVDHVQTQLPYALVAAGIAAVGYLLAGILA
jgi:hypothetical protein